MGRINNGNWVNQHRKIQGKFQNKQDIEAYLFDKKLSNRNNLKEKNRLNTDDLPNIPALLADEPNLSRQSIIEPIDGGKAHTPATQAFLTALTTLSVISPNITASSKKYISTDSQNSVSSTVKSFTEVSKTTPVLFDTTAATTSTSQNHDESKEPTTHNDNQSLVRVKRSWEHYLQPDCLQIDSVTLDTELIKRQLKENSNFTGVCLADVLEIDSQTAQDFATILKNSNINVMSFNPMDIEYAKELIAALKYTNINVLVIPPSNVAIVPLIELTPTLLNHISSVNSQYIQEIIKVLKDTNVEKLILSHNYIVDKEAIYIIKSLKEVGSKVKILDLTNNGISNKGAEDIASELRGTKIVEVQLKKNLDIKPETLQKISMVLEDNRRANEDSYTSTMKSSTTKEESSKDISGKQEEQEESSKDISGKQEEQEESSKDISGKQEEQEDLTTHKGNIIEKSEPIAEDSTTTTPKESNPNNPTSSAISNESSVIDLIALAVAIIGAIGGAVVYVTKKFYDGKKSYTHDDLPLAEPILDSHLDNNQDIPLTGVVVDEGII